MLPNCAWQVTVVSLSGLMHVSAGGEAVGAMWRTDRSAGGELPYNLLTS